MIKKLLKNKLFIILVIIVLFFIIIKLFFTSSKDEKIQKKTPSFSNTLYSLPTPSPNPNLYPEVDEIIDLNHQIPLARLLPYQGKYFKVVRYLKANNLELIVFDKSYNQLAKQEAQEWLIQNGVENLDHFTVVY